MLIPMAAFMKTDGFGHRDQLTKARDKINPPVVFILWLASNLLSCSLPGVAPPARVMGLHAFQANGVSLWVESVEISNDLIALRLRAINGNKGPMRLSDATDPMLLRDDVGGEYPSKNEKIEIPAQSMTALRVEFAGPLKAGARELTLLTNSKYGNNFYAPAFALAHIPATSWRDAAFAEPLVRRLPLNESTTMHPNGLSMTLTEVVVEDNEIKVSFLAVNGHKDEVKLAESNDETFMQDEQANRYYLIPPPNNAELRLPARARMSGTLHFAGRLAPSARRLSLHFNERFGGTQDFSNDPKIVIEDLPVGE